MAKQPYKMEFDIGTIKHLGLQMYSTLPPVIAELVSNAWDANATKVKITIPTTPLSYETSEIVVEDNGMGMSDNDIRKAYLIVGRDRRFEEGCDTTKAPFNRKVMGRKGIGKFSAFGVANVIEVESIKDKETSRFILDYKHLEEKAANREILLPPLDPTKTVKKGTRITLRKITKFQNRSIQIQAIRRGLARRFSIIGASNNFEIEINTESITPKERDLKALLQKDAKGRPYIWEFNEEIKPQTGWFVSGWIGAYDKTRTLEDGIGYGITIMARGKLVQEPFVFETTVGQQFALSYLVGELHAEFVDAEEDTIGTTRNSLVWETEPNKAFLEWGQKQVNSIAREWAAKRSADNEAELDKNPLYQNFKSQLSEIENRRSAKIVDKLVRDTIKKDVVSTPEQLQNTIQMCIDYLEFDTFIDIAQDLSNTESQDIPRLLELFREWEIIEAKEMAKVTQGRIETIEKLQSLIDTNALEVPTLHNFLKTFPWVLDPRWTLIADEKTYSDLLKDKYPESADLPEDEKRIDFLCVREGTTLVVAEIKRPKSRASRKELEQIENYVIFMREYVRNTTDPDMRYSDVVGYLLCGALVDTLEVRGRRDNLANSRIYVKLYGDLLRMVENSHKEFLERYEDLRQKRRDVEK